jgi:hypothetical protein
LELLENPSWGGTLNQFGVEVAAACAVGAE